MDDCDECERLFVITENETLNNIKDFLRIAPTGSINKNHDDCGNTLLHRAIHLNQLKIVNYLLSNPNINVNSPSHYGRTPIFESIFKNNLEITKKLMDLGANVNHKTLTDNTPLHVAVEYYPDCVQYLVQNGANVNAKRIDEMTPLLLSVNNPKILKILIENGGNINKIDNKNESALYKATKLNNIESVCTLLYFNADANNERLFINALTSENFELQEILLNYIDFRDINIFILSLTHQSPFFKNVYNKIKMKQKLYNYADYIFCTCVKNNNFEMFEFVWTNILVKSKHFEIPLDENLTEDYVKIILKSENVEPIIRYDSIRSPKTIMYSRLIKILQTFFIKKYSLDLLTEFICFLLTNGYRFSYLDYEWVYKYFGYCELFKILLNIETVMTKSVLTVSFTSQLICDVTTPIRNLLDYYTENIILFSVDENNILELLKFSIYPKFIKKCLSLDRFCGIRDRILRLPRVPSLLELSRNVTRDYIIEEFEIDKTYQYFTIINYMNIADDYKKILTFQTQLYRLNY